MRSLRIAFFLVGCLAASTAFADWLALAFDKGGAWGIAVRMPSRKQAESLALKECIKAKGLNCEMAGASDMLGYVVLASSKTYVQVFVDDTLDEAKRSAMDGCALKSGLEDSCKITWMGLNGVLRKQPATQQASDCRARPREVGCRSGCLGGSCVPE